MKKKIILTAAMTLALGVTLTACNQSAGTSVPSNTGAATQPTTDNSNELKEIYDELKAGKKVSFEFWHSFGDAVSAPLKELIEQFEEEMTAKGFNITVNVTNKGGGYDGLRSSINLGADSGSIPTLALGYPDHFADYIKQDLLQPLDSYAYNSYEDISLDGVTSTKNDFISTYWEETQMIINGQTRVAGIPFNKSTEIMYYNSSMVDPILYKLGYITYDESTKTYGDWINPTWEQLFAVGKYINDNKTTLTYKHNNAEYSVDKDMRFPIYVDSQSNFFITTSRQWNGAGKYTTIDSDGKGTVTAYNNANKATQEYFLDKAKNNIFQFPGAGGTGSYGSSYMATNKAFISIGSTAGVKNNASKNYYLKTTTVPQKEYGANANNAVIQQGTNLAILKKASDKYQMMASWLLIKFLSSSESQVYFSTQTGYLPVRQSARETEEFNKLLNCYKWNFSSLNAEDKMYFSQYAEVSKGINSALAETNYYYTDPAFNGSSIVRDELETCVNDMYLYGKTFDQAMTAFYNTLAKSRITVKKGE